MHREYLPDDRSDIGFGSRLAHRRKPFINRFAYDVRESDATLAKRLRLAESFGIEPYIHQSRAHAVKIACLYSIAKSMRRLGFQTRPCVQQRASCHGIAGIYSNAGTVPSVTYRI
jgi:hypothetical protein